MDQRDRILGRSLRVGHDECEWLPREDDLALSERLEHAHVARIGGVEVSGGHDRDHAGHLERRPRIDRDDRGASVGAEHEPAVQQARDSFIGGEARTATYASSPCRQGSRDADHRSVHIRVCHAPNIAVTDRHGLRTRGVDRFQLGVPWPLRVGV